MNVTPSCVYSSSANAFSLSIDDEWVPTNLDDGHLDYYFIVLAGFMGLTIAYFYWISYGYQYKTSKDLAIFEEDDDNSGNAATADNAGLLDNQVDHGGAAK